MGNLGGLSGLASQFGVNVPMESTTDLSSPSLFPELLRSRTFAEKILDKQFYTKEFGKELSLLAILTHGDEAAEVGKETLITEALQSFGDILVFEQDPLSIFSVLKVTTSEPLLSKKLTEVVLAELEALNRYFKSQTVNEKISFINQRIASVEDDLEASEQALKTFNEKNRQIASPALQLELERLTRDVEIQKGIFLTLKQQLELAKIEEVQESSILQVLDMPQIAIKPSNKNLKLSILLAGVLGFCLGISFGFIRSYFDNKNIDERKKIRRIKHFLKKKTKQTILDRRVSGVISLLMLVGLPFYLGYESKNPVYFGRYSPKLMIVIIVYVLMMLTSIGLYIYESRKKSHFH